MCNCTSEFDAEPVIRPRFARTGWHRPGTTALMATPNPVDSCPLLIRLGAGENLRNCRLKSALAGCRKTSSSARVRFRPDMLR